MHLESLRLARSLSFQCQSFTARGRKCIHPGWRAGWCWKRLPCQLGWEHRAAPAYSREPDAGTLEAAHLPLCFTTHSVRTTSSSRYLLILQLQKYCSSFFQLEDHPCSAASELLLSNSDCIQLREATNTKQGHNLLPFHTKAQNYTVISLLHGQARHMLEVY